MKKKKIIDAFMFRHACKEFDSEKKIPESKFATILEAARLSPSSFGYEPWEFLIIQNPEIRAQLIPFFWGGIRQIPSASHLVVCLVKKDYFMHYGSNYINHIKRDVKNLPEEIIQIEGEFYKNFQESDFDLLSNPISLREWATHQTYIPLANMMTVAALLKIDSCPMEGFDKKLFDKFLEEELKIDIGKMSVAYGVAFGYRKQEPRPKTRQKIEEITTWIN